MKLRTFKVNFKLYYHEICDWSSSYIKAENKRAALLKFAKLHKIKGADVRRPEGWRWWRDDWYNAFHGIEEVSNQPRTCAACNGVGTIGG